MGENTRPPPRQPCFMGPVFHPFFRTLFLGHVVTFFDIFGTMFYPFLGLVNIFWDPFLPFLEPFFVLFVHCFGLIWIYLPFFGTLFTIFLKLLFGTLSWALFWYTFLDTFKRLFLYFLGHFLGP